MKTGRNDACLCGSGKKYKHCCMNATSPEFLPSENEENNIASGVSDEIGDEMSQRMAKRNHQPNPDYCGLSPDRIHNWMYAPLDEIDGLTVSVPDDLSHCPVMRYLAIILDAMMENDGVIKATAKGNLPTSVVKKSGTLWEEFNNCPNRTHISLSQYNGRNEDDFNALHYTRILAEISGIIYLRSGKWHFKKTEQKDYQQQGVGVFFKPMLQAATREFNWAYFDGYCEEINLSQFWVFMLWRFANHGSVVQLTREVGTAFPMLKGEIGSDLYPYRSQEELLGSIISSRFINRFLGFWGMATLGEFGMRNGKLDLPEATAQPLLEQSFKFSV